MVRQNDLVHSPGEHMISASKQLEAFEVPNSDSMIDCSWNNRSFQVSSIGIE